MRACALRKPVVVEEQEEEGPGYTPYGTIAPYDPSSSIVSTDLGTRLFPRSAFWKGFPHKQGETPVAVGGPFGRVIALRIQNDGTEPCWVYQQGGARECSIYVPSGGIRRLEFETPAENGTPISILSLIIYCEVAETAKIYVEVE